MPAYLIVRYREPPGPNFAEVVGVTGDVGAMPLDDLAGLYRDRFPPQTPTRVFFLALTAGAAYDFVPDGEPTPPPINVARVPDAEAVGSLPQIS